MNITEVFQKGGFAMWVLLVLSIVSLTIVIERLWFWFGIVTEEREVMDRVLESARRSWEDAAEIARRAKDQPIGRFLYSALQLNNPNPEVFKLALESAADEELGTMRRGEKFLEAVIALSPASGLLGTVSGLIVSLRSIRIGDLGTASTEGVTSGIGEALITTATGLAIAIFTLIFYRLFQALVLWQAKIFRKSGNELELMYRIKWAKADDRPITYMAEGEAWDHPVDPQKSLEGSTGTTDRGDIGDHSDSL